MANGDEHGFPGGIRYHDGEDDGTRTEVSLIESGPDKVRGLFTLGLCLTSGSSCYHLTGVSPDEMKKLGRWLYRTARDLEADAAARGT